MEVTKRSSFGPERKIVVSFVAFCQNLCGSPASTLQRFNASTMQRVTSAARFLIKHSDCALVEGLRIFT